MISFEKFEKYINAIKTVHNYQDERCNLMRKYEFDYSIENASSLLEGVVINLLEHCMNDEKYNNISWWIYDCEFGTKNAKVYLDKKEIDLSDIKNLYNFLKEQQNGDK